MQPIAAEHLLTEYLENPLGIDARRPGLSWQMAGGRRGSGQSAYQIQATTSSNGFTADAGMDLLWDTGKIFSDRSLDIPYEGSALASRERVFWQVRIWDQDDHPSDWSEPAWWEMGLLEENDWNADWIEVDWEEDSKAFNPSPYLRRGFTLDRPVKSARLYITAHGLYEAWLNGQRVGDQVLTPGFTAYDLRLQYQVYDVSSLLSQGENTLGAILGDGWYRGEIYLISSRNVYGERLALLAQLEIETSDGKRIMICSDSQWKATTGPILMSDLKAGETYDFRLELPGWSSPDFESTAKWKGVRAAAYPKNNLIASMSVPVRRKETFAPKAILKTPKGETVIDFGQNLSGVVRMKASGPAGTTIHLTHGEALDQYGNFTMENVMMQQVLPFQEDTFILKGEGVEEFDPHFTIHGFQYVKVEGYPGEIKPENFCSVAIYSDMPPTGTFSCSSQPINQLHSNVIWSMKSNFADIPTDCPQRERAGWVGDPQIFAPSAAFLMDTRSFFRKWLKDLSLEQREDGMLGNFVPNPAKLSNDGLVKFSRNLDGAAGWGDAAVLLPWAQYWAYGDLQLLETQYASMKAWVDYVERQARTQTNLSTKLNPRYWFDRSYRQRVQLLWDSGYHWGEWLEPGAVYGNAILMALKRLFVCHVYGCVDVSTAYFATSARILSQTAALLGKNADAQKYQALAEKVKETYLATVIGKDGRMTPDTQAAYVRVLALDLAPQALRPGLVENLVRLIRTAGNHVGTGFLSTAFLCQMLAENGRLDVAYELLNQTTAPSWLYEVGKGATTVWELWDGIREDGSVNPSASLNHYSPGAIANFLHRKVAGIEATEPGYQCITIHPRPGGGLTSASATYQSAHGLIASEWKQEAGRMSLFVTIPPNTRAEIVLPGASMWQVLENGEPLAQAEGVVKINQSGLDVRVDVGSGSYCFEYPIVSA
jgi:alpha-L-rhamnosidase